jgi:hypothetical protein
MHERGEVIRDMYVMKNEKYFIPFEKVESVVFSLLC